MVPGRMVPGNSISGLYLDGSKEFDSLLQSSNDSIYPDPGGDLIIRIYDDVHRLVDLMKGGRWNRSWNEDEQEEIGVKAYTGE